MTDLRTELHEYARRRVDEALQLHYGNRSAAARTLGIKRTTLVMYLRAGGRGIMPITTGRIGLELEQLCHKRVTEAVSSSRTTADAARKLGLSRSSMQVYVDRYCSRQSWCRQYVIDAAAACARGEWSPPAKASPTPSLSDLLEVHRMYEAMS